jgi:hypothetical protein
MAKNGGAFGQLRGSLAPEWVVPVGGVIRLAYMASSKCSRILWIREILIGKGIEKTPIKR